MLDDRKAAGVPRSRITYHRCRTAPLRAHLPVSAELEIEVVDRQAGFLVVAVSGEIDLSTADALRDRLAELGRDGADLVVDFAGVRFCDATGLGSLVAARNRLSPGGARIRLAGVRPAQRRLFGVTGLDQLIPLYGTVAEAAAGGRASSLS